MIDRDGADALTMRALAGELGVEAMSLYRHVEGRSALLDGVATQLMGEIEPRGASGDWAQAVRGFASSVRGVAHKHPRAFELVAARLMQGPGALRPVEDLLASLRGAGFTPARAIAAYRLVAAYTHGYTLCEISGFAFEREALAGVVDGRFPTVRSLARQLAGEPAKGTFGAGLELLIAGLRAEGRQ
jgi:AcrR family transcriptional regulator